MAHLKADVLIIGGGATGTGLARDLALRGVQCILVEKEDINAGASGRNHGLLHSGARYVCSDQEAARECREEGELIKQLAPHCVENTGGLFAAVEGDDESYVADFPKLCTECGIPAKSLDIRDAREMEPELSENLIGAYMVEDASIDPFMLSLENIGHAQRLGSTYMRHLKVVGFRRSKNQIQSVQLKNTLTGKETTIEADHVVNAAGVWAGEIAGLADINIDMVYSKGTLLITQNRITQRVINRLRKASDADILVPGGTVSIIGTTSTRTDDLDNIFPTVKEVDFIIKEGEAMLPVLRNTRYIRAYSGVRPLVKLESASDDRDVSRGYTLIDHTKNGLENFITITGGKLTTYRLMAEKTADMVCQHFGVSAPCKTRTEPFPSSEHGKWTEPGFAPRKWMQKNDPSDILLCECEMVSESAVDDIIASLANQHKRPDLCSIGLRSRVGKGPCQGTFCSLRIASYMYDQGYLVRDHGVGALREFLRKRWRGQRPLLWDTHLVQAELQEAMHCGFFGLELESSKKSGGFYEHVQVSDQANGQVSDQTSN